MKKENTFTNLHNIELFFTSEKKCIEFLEKVRWNNEPACLRCGSLNPYVITNNKRKGYKCRECAYKFNVLIGTIFENTKIPLVKWFKAIYIITSHKKGISSIQLGKDLGLTQTTAWFVLGRVRKLAESKTPFMLEGTVQVDETYVGGKIKNKHAHIREKYKGNKNYNKTMVLGLVENNGRIVNKVIPAVQSKYILPEIQKHVKAGSIMVTDDALLYRALPKLGYTHKEVMHGMGEYVYEGFTTNKIEGYFSLLKRGIYGIFHQVSRKHLFRYCNEFSFRYNTRELSEVERFEFALNQLESTRLKYSEYIKDVEPSAGA